MAGRVTQVTVEAVIAATSSTVRTTQVAVEAVIAATDAAVRTTQVAVEAVIAPTSQNLVVSQAGLEVARFGDPTLVVSQAGIEVLRAPDPSEVDLLVSQAGIEVAYEVPKGTFTLDARLSRPVTGDFTTDAIVKATVTTGPWVDGSWTDGTWVEGHATFAINTRAVLFKNITASTTFNAIKRQIFASSFTVNARVIGIPVTRTYGTKSVFYGYSGAPIVIKTPNQGQPQEIVIPGCNLIISGSPITITWDVWQSHFQWAVDKKEIIYIRRDSLTGLAIWSDDPQKEETDAGNNATGMQWHFSGSYTETARSGRYVLTVKPAKGNATLYASEIHFTLSTPGDGPGMTVDALIKKPTPASFGVFSRIYALPGPVTYTDIFAANADIKQFGRPGSVEVNATLFVWGLGAFFTYATVARTTESSFAVDAVKYEAYGGGFTWTDSFRTDALIGPHTGLFASDAAVLAPADVSFGVDASISGAISVDAVIYRLIAITWTTPPDGVSITPTETLAFLTPALNGSQHFEIQLDTVDSFDGPDLRVLKSHYDLAGWEFWDGGAWVALPVSGMPNTYGGNEARYTIQTPLTGGTWYRRVRAGEI
jgi:hypothetical protein